MTRDPTPIWCFALVVVRQDDKFLVIQERKHGQLWYLPAGRVERTEDFFTAARREAEEEAGFRVRLTGIVRMEHTPVPGDRARLRIVFEGVPEEPIEHPQGGQDALAAAWVTPAEAAELPLRAEELPALFRHVANEGSMPIQVLTREDAPYPIPSCDS
ncbi:MAG: NUDIX domain-containing protein [Gemmatimonadales bacterium]